MAERTIDEKERKLSREAATRNYTNPNRLPSELGIVLGPYWVHKLWQISSVIFFISCVCLCSGGYFVNRTHLYINRIESKQSTVHTKIAQTAEYFFSWKRVVFAPKYYSFGENRSRQHSWRNYRSWKTRPSRQMWLRWRLQSHFPRA